MSVRDRSWFGPAGGEICRTASLTGADAICWTEELLEAALNPGTWNDKTQSPGRFSDSAFNASAVCTCRLHSWRLLHSNIRVRRGGFDDG